MFRIAAAVAALAFSGQPAPVFSTPEEALERALACERVRPGTRPILLVPGTSETPRMYAWNWLRYAAARGWATCTVELPQAATADVQVNGEHVAYAIRRLYAATGRRVRIIGHSQGGMVPRWALEHWPDTRAMVEDVVGLAASNHGTLTAIPVCQLECPAAFSQQRIDARFIAALNDGGETHPGIDYTVAFTRYDEIVVPNQDAESGSSALRSGGGRIANVRVQDLCPGNLAEHLAMGTYDPVAHAVAVDALEHDGPADPARIDRAVCSSAFMPGVDGATFSSDYLAYTADVAAATGAAERVAGEPPLRCYATGDCAPRELARLELKVTPRRVAQRRRVRVRLQATVVRGDGWRHRPRGGVVEFLGRRLELDATGRATVTTRFGTRRIHRALAVVPDAGVAEAALRVVRRR